MKNISKIPVMKTDSKIAIFNRGEAALRFIRGVKEFNLRYKHNLKNVVILSEDDRASLIERSADNIIRLKKNNVYQVDRELIDLLKNNNCDALWPGWGFASENPELPLQLEKNGIVFIGPGADAIKLLGDKIEAKKAAEKCNINVIPWEMATGTEEIKKKAKNIGYPLILKASDGGGGRGIRIVHSAKQVQEAVAQIGRESGGKIFLEKFLDDVKHIEVQIVADNHGSVEVYGMRDCSLQRRRQKVIEESPPPFITKKKVEKLGKWSKELAQSVGYKNAGTVEFLYSTPNDFYFLEMNPRLQVEHGITEETHGIDLVHMQLLAAMGKKLAKTRNSNGKVSIEARIYAEDPSSDFIPAPGKIKKLYFGTGPGIRIDQGVMEGDEISSKFDPMIAKIIASGYSRSEALGRLYRVLDESEILIENGTTNIPFLKFLIKQEEVQKGVYKINDIDNHILKRYLDIPGNMVEPSLIAAAILEHRKREGEKVYNFNVRPLLAGSTNKVQPINLTSIKGEASLKVNRIDFNNYLIKSSDTGFINVNWICEGVNRAKFIFNNRSYKIKFLTRAGEWRIFLDSYSIIYLLKDKGIIKAPSPAIVSYVHVKEGDIVKEGDSIVTLEAMKMEIEIKAKENVTIQRVEVRQGSQVFAGGILARFRSNDEKNLKTINISSRKNYPTPSEALDILNSVFTGFEAGENELEMALKSLADFDEEGIDDLLPKVYNLIRQAALILKLTSPIRKFRVRNHVQKNASGKALLALLIRRPSVVFHNLPENFLKLLREILLQHGIKKPAPGKELNYSLFLLRRVLNQSKLLHRAITDLLAFLNGIKYRIASPPLQLENDLLQLSDDVTGNYRQTDLAENIRSYLFEKPIIEEYKKNIRGIINDYLQKKTNKQELKEKIRGADVEELSYLISNQSKLKEQVDLLDILAWYYWGEYITSSNKLNIKRKKAIKLELNYLSRGENKKTGQTRILVISSSKKLSADLKKLGNDEDSDALELIINESWNQEIELRKILSESGVHFKEINFVFVPDNLVKTFRSPIGNAYVETDNLCELHPASAIRLELWRFSSFKMERVEHRSRLYLFRLQAENKPKDKRLLIMSEVFDPIIVKDEDGRVQMPNVDMAFKNACQMLRKSITFKDERKKYPWNHMILAINPMPSDLESKDMKRISGSLIPYGARLGIDQVLIYTDIYKKDEEFYLPWRIKIRGKSTEGLFFNQGVRDMDIIRPLDENLEQEIKARRRGVNSPESILRIICKDLDGNDKGSFEQWEVVVDPATGRQHLARKAWPDNKSEGIIFGILNSPTKAVPEGIKRVAIISNPLKSMGSLSEDECRRIIAAITLAHQKELSIYWLPVSAGAKIDFKSGTENLDWTARVLRKIVDFTEDGGMIDILIGGVNVGAQSYFDAEATMLHSTRGFLVMTEKGSMVLTGKRALDISGSVSAEDNLGIGGAERVMFPSGQSQAMVKDLAAGHRLLLEHAELYWKNNEKLIKIDSSDKKDRNICEAPYPVELGHGFSKIKAIFSEEKNPGRKKPFSVRPIMEAVKDKNSPKIERWGGITDGAQGVITWETRIGGFPAGFLGIEAVPVSRMGVIPPDGPENWSGSTLFPKGAYKIARSLNSFSGSLPAIIFANLAGFDGSPESLRKWQLIHGARIGRALVNFSGPVLLVVLSRYHGGAYVVFSTALQDSMEAIALEGSYASVIGGSAAASVVFNSSIKRKVEKIPSIVSLRKKVDSASGKKRIQLEAKLTEMLIEKKGELRQKLASKFDKVHSVDRAARVGSLKAVINPADLRAYIIDFLETKLA